MARSQGHDRTANRLRAMRGAPYQRGKKIASSHSPAPVHLASPDCGPKKRKIGWSANGFAGADTVGVYVKTHRKVLTFGHIGDQGARERQARHHNAARLHSFTPPQGTRGAAGPARRASGSPCRCPVFWPSPAKNCSTYRCSLPDTRLAHGCE